LKKFFVKTDEKKNTIQGQMCGTSGRMRRKPKKNDELWAGRHGCFVTIVTESGE